MPLYINLLRSGRTITGKVWHSLKERFSLYISLTTISFDIFLHILIDIKFIAIWAIGHAWHGKTKAQVVQQT